MKYRSLCLLLLAVLAVLASTSQADKGSGKPLTSIKGDSSKTKSSKKRSLSRSTVKRMKVKRQGRRKVVSPLVEPAPLPKAVNVTVLTWNMAETSPARDDCDFMEAFQATSDIIVLGIQECENIKPRRHEGSRSRMWRGLQKELYHKNYKCMVQHKIGGLQLAVHVRKPLHKQLIQHVQVLDVACGIGNVLTNKGAICALLRIQDRTLALTNAHFAAHVDKVKERNADFCRVTANIADRAPLDFLHKDSVSANLARERRKAFEKSLKHSDQPWLEHLLHAAGCPTDQQLVRLAERNLGGRAARNGKGHKRLPSAKGTSKSQYRVEDEGLRPPLTRRRHGMRRGKGKGKRPRKGKSLSNKPRRDINTKATGSTGSTGASTDIAAPVVCLDWPFDAVIFFGDLNYRLNLPRLEIEEMKHLMSVDASHSSRLTLTHITDALQSLLNYDQLRREMTNGRVFTRFQEGDIAFHPTFKYDRRSDAFDSSSKFRPPAWTDRVLYFVESAPQLPPSPEDISKSIETGEVPSREVLADVPPMLELLNYESIAATHSDHRPVKAVFRLNLEA